MFKNVKFEKKVYRKAVLADFITEPKNDSLDKKKINKNDKIKNYRIQGDLGEKKYIKP